MIGYRPYVVPWEESEESLVEGLVEDLAGSYSAPRTSAGTDVGGPASLGSAPTSPASTDAPKSDKEYVVGQIRALAAARKGDSSVAGIKTLLLDYDRGGKWCLDKDDIVRLLDDAGVCVKKMGLCIPQSMVASNIIQTFDTSGDGCVSWEEFRVGAGLKETDASLAIVTREPSASAGTGSPTSERPASGKTSALLGLSLALAVPLGILIWAGRTTPTSRPPEPSPTSGLGGSPILDPVLEPAPVRRW